MIEKIKNKQAYWDLADKLNEVIDIINAALLDLPPKSSLEVGSECPECYGKGWLRTAKDSIQCYDCNGTGKVAQNEPCERHSKAIKEAIGHVTELEDKLARAEIALGKIANSNSVSNELINIATNYFEKGDKDA